MKRNLQHFFFGCMLGAALALIGFGPLMVKTWGIVLVVTLVYLWNVRSTSS